VLTIVAGLVWRLGPLHLGAFALKYGGSVLYAAMLYGLVVVAFPYWRVRWVAALALALAFLVEAFKLVHWAALDAFRYTLAGKLVLGRVFTMGALVAYAAGVAAAALLDAGASLVRATSGRR
jgi:hypothetical protein